MLLTIYLWSVSVAFAFCAWRILIDQQNGMDIQVGRALFRCSVICITPLLNTIFSVGIIGTFLIATTQRLIKLYYYVKASNRSTTRSRKG
jgi:hypothetical protein